MHRSPVIALCALLVLGGFLTTALAGQGGNQEDLSKRVATLEAALKEAKELAELQSQVLRDLDKRLKAIESWVDKVPQSMIALKNAVDASEKAGFTYPAPNTRSKEMLLNALRKLGSDLSAPAKAPPAPKK